MRILSLVRFLRLLHLHVEESLITLARTVVTVAANTSGNNNESHNNKTNLQRFIGVVFLHLRHLLNGEHTTILIAMLNSTNRNKSNSHLRLFEVV